MDETQELLLSMLEDLTSAAEEEREDFMALCIQSLNKLKKSDLVTPVFIFERLCNIIRPVSARYQGVTLHPLSGDNAGVTLRQLSGGNAGVTLRSLSGGNAVSAIRG